MFASFKDNGKFLTGHVVFSNNMRHMEKLMKLPYQHLIYTHQFRMKFEFRSMFTKCISNLHLSSVYSFDTLELIGSLHNSCGKTQNQYFVHSPFHLQDIFRFKTHWPRVIGFKSAFAS